MDGDGYLEGLGYLGCRKSLVELKSNIFVQSVFIDRILEQKKTALMERLHLRYSKNVADVIEGIDNVQRVRRARYPLMKVENVQNNVVRDIWNSRISLFSAQ